ncbi:uncharacterized protein LOC106644821 [Copidosoma floridanum]|uniref:uncharacterized protein LOC106644821 n=1 Tax=Copidosoma floridanum TaxID=29053 RepID=UPI0006C98016|nr:uncharacterized protein LOC106644821 [Copidosoma floridanum]
MINNQQRIILNTGDTNIHHQPVSSKPSIVSVSSIDSDVSDRRDIREALYTGIFKRHRKTILVLGSFLKMLRKHSDRLHAMNLVFVPIVMKVHTNVEHKYW